MRKIKDFIWCLLDLTHLFPIFVLFPQHVQRTPPTRRLRAYFFSQRMHHYAAHLLLIIASSTALLGSSGNAHRIQVHAAEPSTPTLGEEGFAKPPLAEALGAVGPPAGATAPVPAGAPTAAAALSLPQLRVVSTAGDRAVAQFQTSQHITQCVWGGDTFTFFAPQSNANLLVANVTAQSMAFGRPLSVKGHLNTTRVLHHGNVEWMLWNLDTFDVGSREWTNPLTSTCGLSSDIFLGGHCKYGGGAQTQKTFKTLPPHTMARVTARVHFLDKWLGETLILTLDDKPVWTRSYKWCDQVITSQCLKHGVDACGKSFPDRLSLLLTVDVPHTKEAATLKFSSTLPAERDPCDVSWGIDDVAIYLKLA